MMRSVNRVSRETMVSAVNKNRYMHSQDFAARSSSPQFFSKMTCTDPGNIF